MCYCITIVLLFQEAYSNLSKNMACEQQNFYKLEQYCILVFSIELTFDDRNLS